ncbi:MAG: aminoglycoside phosphotransferase family protein [Paracoccaceae bacterium]
MNVACDSAAPFLDVCQSPEIYDAVGDVLGRRPQRVDLERTHFPGKRPVQLVLHAVMPDGQAYPVLAEHCPEDPHSHADRARVSLGKSRNGQRNGLDATALRVVAGAGLVLRRPGLDERLPGLRLLYDPAFARTALQSVIGKDPRDIAVELVAHRLGRRAVLRITSRDRVVYARLRAIKSSNGADRLGRHRELWHSLSRQSDLRIPEPLGAIPDIGVAFFGVLPGTPPDFGASDSTATTRAIRALQALEPAGLPVHTGADEARILVEWLNRCHRWRPGIAARVAAPVAQISAALKRSDASPRPCHRDLHEKQILIADSIAGLLDFDTLCLSDPALDVGNLLAHLYLAEVDEAPVRSHLRMSGIALWRRGALLRLAMIYAFTSTPARVLDRLIREGTTDAED